MVIIYIILGTILFLLALAAGGVMIVRHYLQSIMKRLFGNNEKGSKTEYTQNNNRRTRQQPYTNNPTRRQEGKIFADDEGEYIDFEEIKE